MLRFFIMDFKEMLQRKIRNHSVEIKKDEYDIFEGKQLSSTIVSFCLDILTNYITHMNFIGFP